MPFTPFHFGPSATIALPLKRHIDVPAFLLANVAIDIEPLLVLTLSLRYPLHGYAHTFLGATVVCTVMAIGLHHCRRFLVSFTRIFIPGYDTTKRKLIVSSVLGGWFHVLLDSMIYHDIRPLYPLSVNPFLGWVGQDQMYVFCSIMFAPALAIFFWGRWSSGRAERMEGKVAGRD
jgi:membrane-bound metal-dependent hydrolase YbcI (DUF457 family)